MKIILIYLLFFTLSIPIFSSPIPSTLSFHFSGGTTIGWWINRMEKGYTRTRTYSFPAVRSEILYNRKNWTGGIGFSYSFLPLTNMYGPSYSDKNSDLIRISTGKVGLTDIFLSAGYKVAGNKRISLQILTLPGFFFINTLHPDHELLKNRFSLQIGLRTGITLYKELKFTFEPLYIKRWMKASSEAIYPGQHHFYQFGVMSGLSYTF